MTSLVVVPVVLLIMGWVGGSLVAILAAYSAYRSLRRG